MSGQSAAGIVNAFKAEALLEDSHIIERIASLRANLQYTTDGDRISFDDYFTKLQGLVDGLERLTLQVDLPPGTENQYTIQLITAQEKILDDCDRVLRKVMHFEGKLKDAQREISKLAAEFKAWYILAANQLLDGIDVKLPPAQVKDLAEAEFSRLMENLDVAIDSLIAAVQIETSKAKQHKNTQKEKYTIGKQQADASWTSTMGSFGNTFAPSRADHLLSRQASEDDLDEGVPAFISRKPQIAAQSPLRVLKPAVCGDAAAAIDAIPDAVAGAYLQGVENGEIAEAPRAACTVCGRLQFDTPSGVSCENGHGGALGVAANIDLTPVPTGAPAPPSGEPAAIKGVFRKVGDPQPVNLAVDDGAGGAFTPKPKASFLNDDIDLDDPEPAEPPTPRKRLILDEEIV